MSRINSEVKALFVNGVKLPIVDGSFTWNRGGKTREAVLGSNQVLGPAETNAAGTCSFDVAYVAGSDPTDYDNLIDAQIRVVWDIGAEWLLKRAFSNEGASGTAGSGTYSLSYTGDPWLLSKK
jgi:hypothetical protein